MTDPLLAPGSLPNPHPPMITPMRTPERQHAHWIVVAALLTAATPLAVRPCEAQRTLTTVGRLTSPLGHSAYSAPADIQPIVGFKNKVPEWHDVQGLRLCTGNSCDPKTRKDYALVAQFWADEHLDDWKDVAAFADSGHRVGAVEVFAGVQNGHDELELELGRNEILLWYDPKEANEDNKWKAQVYRWASHSVKDLSVTRKPYAGQPQLVPGVAQWDEDAKSGRPLLGVKCGDGWCFLGKKGSKPEPSATPTCPVSGAGAFVCQYGWFDRQELAVRGAQGLKYGGAVGVLIPHPGLKDETFPTIDKEYDVAWVSVTNADYAKTAPFTLNLKQDKMYRLVLVRTGASGTSGEYDGVPYTEGVFKLILKDDADKPVQSYQVRQWRHSGGMPPGVARWKWSPTDEGFWFRCDVGCCEATADFLGGGGDGENPLTRPSTSPPPGRPPVQRPPQRPPQRLPRAASAQPVRDPSAHMSPERTHTASHGSGA